MVKSEFEGDETSYQLWLAGHLFRRCGGFLLLSSTGRSSTGFDNPTLPLEWIIWKWSLCNLALVNGGNAGLSEPTKKAKLAIEKTEGMKAAGHHFTKFGHDVP